MVDAWDSGEDDSTDAWADSEYDSQDESRDSLTLHVDEHDFKKRREGEKLFAYLRMCRRLYPEVVVEDKNVSEWDPTDLN